MHSASHVLRHLSKQRRLRAAGRQERRTETIRGRQVMGKQAQPPLHAPICCQDLLAEYILGNGGSSGLFSYMPRMREDAERAERTTDRGVPRASTPRSAKSAVPYPSTPHSPTPPRALDTSSPAVHLHLDKCVLCTRCVRACSELQVRGRRHQGGTSDMTGGSATTVIDRSTASIDASAHAHSRSRV